VLHHTDLSRESGNVNGLELDTLNWGAYDLVVIDESHNFRNNKLATQRLGDKEERRSRYQRLMEDIISSGVKTKVLLLSATPVTTSWRTSATRSPLSPARRSPRRNRRRSICREAQHPVGQGHFAAAQTQFTNWAKKPPGQRKTASLSRPLAVISSSCSTASASPFAKSDRRLLRW